MIVDSFYSLLHYCMIVNLLFYNSLLFVYLESGGILSLIKNAKIEIIKKKIREFI